MKRFIAYAIMVIMALSLICGTAVSAITVSNQEDSVVIEVENKKPVIKKNKSKTMYATEKVKLYQNTSTKAKYRTIKYGSKITKVCKYNKKWYLVKYKRKYYFTKEIKKFSKRMPLWKPSKFRVAGRRYYQGRTWTWYSTREGWVGNPRTVRWGPIPGWHFDKNGFVVDKNNYICLASNSLRRHQVINTPFGKKGKVYDTGCYGVDVFTCW